MNEYTQQFRCDCVRKMTGPNAMSAMALSKTVRASQSTLSYWLRKARSMGLENYFNMTDSSNKLSPAQKMDFVFKAQALAPDQLGPFLRQHGIHKAQLDRWTQDMLNGLGSKPTSSSSPKPSKADRRRIKTLERELHRKDKALAETAALLVLQKKVQALWGDEDKSTTDNSD